MADRMTSIRLPGSKHVGIADYGRKTPEEMIRLLRMHAEHQKAIADAILAASDADFLIETYTGVYVQRDRTTVQPGRAA